MKRFGLFILFAALSVMYGCAADSESTASAVAGVNITIIVGSGNAGGDNWEIRPVNPVRTLSGTGAACVVSVPFSAYRNGEEVTAVWSSAGNIISSTGVATTSTPGQYPITGRVGDVVLMTTLTVNGSCGSTPPVDSVKSVDLRPNGGTKPVGSTDQLSLVCYSGLNQTGNVIACPTPAVYSSSDNSRITVDNSGLLSYYAAGSSEVCGRLQAPYENLSDCEVFTATAVTTIHTVEIRPSTTYLYPSQCPLAGPTRQQLDLYVDGRYKAASSATWSSSSGAATVVQGLVSSGTPGTATITAVVPEGQATAQVTTNPCPPPAGQFTVGAPGQLRVAGNGCTMVSATTPVSGGTIASASNGGGVVQVTWSGSVVTWTPLAEGQVPIMTFTSTDGRTYQVHNVEVVKCSSPPPPPSSVCSVNITGHNPPGDTVVVGGPKKVVAAMLSASLPTGCRIIWYPTGNNANSTFQVSGDEQVPVGGTIYYPSGLSANIQAIGDGSNPICSQLVQVDPTTGIWSRLDGTGKILCYTWTAKH